MMNSCFTCKREIAQPKIFCNKLCYFARRNFRKHSEETKQKIATGNSKPFTDERKKAISVARTFVPTPELLESLQKWWALKYLSPSVIAKLVGLEYHKSIYTKLYKTYCKEKQFTPMPKNWYPEHYSKLIELGNQGVYYRDIAKVIGFGEKQTFCIAKKIGIKLNTRNPNAYNCIISKPEQLVMSWIIEAGHELTSQFSLGKFLFDGHIPNSNILIEVHGDYWHCNPKVYLSGAINDMQKAHQRRDFAKKDHAKKMGYYLITVWELDIKQRTNEIRQWLLKKVEEHKCKMN